MTVIYEPKGKAREYSPLALNLYMGCNHGCTYCYAPDIAREQRNDYIKPHPRPNILKALKNQLKYQIFQDQVLMSFMSDPYNSLNEELQLTRKALILLKEHKVPVAILTKAGKKVLKDLDVIKDFGPNIKIGMTLTFDNDSDSQAFEPNAANWQERLETLQILHVNKIKTFGSFEPVFYPWQTIDLIKKMIGVLDLFKIGKLNHCHKIEQFIKWDIFLEDIISILRPAKQNFYIKVTLRQEAPKIILNPNEINSDLFALKGWK